MAIISDVTVIPSASRFPSMGTLIGSRVSGEILNQHQPQFQSLFGAEFEQRHHQFMDLYVRPMDQLSLDLQHTVNAVWNPDTFRILQSVQDFRSIPPCMELPILMFEPVRKLYEAGEIDGFGYDLVSLPKEDIFGRLITNQSCSDVLSAMDEDGYVPLEGTYLSDDPEYSDDDIHAMRRTRQYIELVILQDTDRDPTMIDMPRG